MWKIKCFGPLRAPVPCKNKKKRPSHRRTSWEVVEGTGMFFFFWNYRDRDFLVGRYPNGRSFPVSINRWNLFLKNTRDWSSRRDSWVHTWGSWPQSGVLYYVFFCKNNLLEWNCFSLNFWFLIEIDFWACSFFSISFQWFDGFRY